MNENFNKSKSCKYQRENKMWKRKCAAVAFVASQLEDNSACVYYRWLESSTLQYRLFWKLNTYLLGRTRYSYYFPDNRFTFVLPCRIRSCDGNRFSRSIAQLIDDVTNRDSFENYSNARAAILDIHEGLYNNILEQKKKVGYDNYLPDYTITNHDTSDYFE